MTAPAPIRRSIVKVGSSLLVSPKGEVQRDWLVTLVADIAARYRAGERIIIVSSGAIALGARRLGLPKGGRASLEDAQAAAATGQIALSQCWADLLDGHGITAAQILVTLDDLEDRRRYLNASATLDRLLSLGVVPVINENDSVATTEIRFGDNDRLAARIAQAARAQCVILLSDVDGLYTADPSTDSSATRIARVQTITAKIVAMAKGSTSSGMGSGGMASKIEAARIANAAGADLIIVSGQTPHPLARLAREECGTLFVADKASSARKAWLAGRLTVKGRITIDAGAARALSKGASLLAAGATAVEGKFKRGDVVAISNHLGQRIALGIAEHDNYLSSTMCGLSLERIELEIQEMHRSTMIHCNNLVIL